MTSPRGVVLAASHEALAALGRAAGDVVGRSCLRFVPRGLRHDALRRLRALASDAGAHNVDLPLTRGDGTDVSARVRFAAHPLGWVAVLGTSYVPITERERAALRALADSRHAAEQALEASRRWQDAILDNLPDIAWLKGPDGRFRSVNRAFTASLGRETNEIVGLTDLDLFPRELAERYRRDDVEVMRHGSVKIIEEPFVDGRGHRRIIETFKKAVLDERGDVEGTVGLARDITERLAYEETLRSLNDELERRVAERSEELARAQETLLRRERLAVLGQLAGGVAHQIRNPLAAIQNAAHVLERRLGRQAHEDVARALQAIYDEVRRSNDIITGLLDYARVRTPQRRSIHPSELVDRVLAAVALPPGIDVVRVADDLPSLEVDVDQIEGALDNLVQNALDAMPDGGALRLEIHLDGADVVFVVADDGPGLSPQLEGRLFEPLLTTKPSGIGLGLVTARTLAEAHGGTIRFVDATRGARVELRLPAIPSGGA